jgi:GH18 family chitinase
VSRLVVAAFLLALLSSAPRVLAAQKVVGYSTSWSGDAAAIPLSKLTHIHYAFVIPSKDGSVQPVPNPGKLTLLVSGAHAAGKKVLLSVGGWNNGDDSGFEALASSPATRTNFVNSLLTLVTAYGLDGIDVDWEYPDPFGSSSANFSLLMQELCGALHGQGKLCSAAVVATGSTAAGVGTDVFAAVDYLTLMAYDGGSGADHSPYSYAVASLDYWLGRGLPPAKAILGVPFYGRPSWEGYATIVARDPQAPYKDVSSGVYYNGLDTIKAKTALAMQRGGGVMIWELAQDTADEATSLLNAIWSVIGPATIDPAPTPSPTPASR